jgi:hypothetical protein
MNNSSTNYQYSLDWCIDRFFSAESTDEIDAFKNYYNTGCVETYIQSGMPLRGYAILYRSPLLNLDDLLPQLKCYWDWVAEDPDNHCHEYEKSRSIDDRFTSIFQELVRGGERFPVSLLEELFFWVYGKTYDPERQFPMTFGPNQWRPKLDFDIDFMCSTLQRGIRKYLMGYNLRARDKEIATFYKSVIDYFLSIFPYMSRDIFSLELYPRNYSEDGVLINKSAYQIGTRWLIAGLHNILTLYEDDEGITELVIHDQEAMDYLKAGLAKLKMPDEYYRLVEFVKETGFDCLGIED